MSASENDLAAWRIWALEQAVIRNKYATTEKVIAEAEIFSQFIERRKDAEIVSVKIKRPKG